MRKTFGCRYVYSVLFFIGFIISDVSKAQITGKDVPLQTGVSKALADYRKKWIGNIRYKLHFSIPENQQQAIPATETLSFTLGESKQPLEIDFKEKRDHLHQVSVNGKPLSIVFEKEHLIIPASRLQTGNNYVDIQFTAGDLSLNRNDDFLYTLLVPDRARTVFPCFDQPNLKAVFTLSLTLPKEWNAVSSAALLDSVISAGHKTYHYNPSDTISTYLFSFAAGRFDRIAQVENAREMNFYHRETDTTKICLSTDSIFLLHRNAIAYLEDYTAIPFPFQKLDFIAIPDFQYGGMEHVGAIQYKASPLFLDSGATKDQYNSRANVISHETAHMWFGDMVTMQWFNDVWMKEVFANFMADKITQGNQPQSTYELKFLIDHYPAAYGVDRTAGANPIRQQLDNLQEAGTMYGNIIYHKAPVMMRQLERLMGKEPFRDGVREYLKKYKYSNATWPDLISILDDRTPADLSAWNTVWVNEPGRPQIDYDLTVSNGVISKFVVRQQGERQKKYMLPQFFEVAFVYGDSVKEFTVNMNAREVLLDSLAGTAAPDAILFNSSGQGYGIFPVDTNMLSNIPLLSSSVMRASAYINLYENMISGRAVSPLQLMNVCEDEIGTESEELNLRLLTGYISDVFWRLVLPAEREKLAPGLEAILWQAMVKETAPNKKKILFKTYQSIAVDKGAKDTLYHIWQTQKAPDGVILTEDDYTSLALNLALKDYPDTTILQQQEKRIINPDRKKRLRFLMPALSPDSTVRDAFFASLSKEENREKEAWVTAALDYLHHPLRAETSQKYLQKSLDLLPEIQMTGDIFFPAAWLGATLGSYQTPEEAGVVRRFLASHPDYNAKLKAKILQAADPLFRAEKLVYGK